jgi:serine/threonine-protein kinase
LSESYREPSDPLCGVILDGRYRVAEVVGVGAMGVVYRAQQVSAHGRDVAIKVLSSHALGHATVTKRFEMEARVIAQLRHPNTLKMIDSGRFGDGRLYIVTEFLFGIPLSEIAESLPRDPIRTLRIIRQVCDSLAEAHGLGIIHRDLKPSNIYLEAVAGQEIVKVLDFGLAKLLEVPGLTLPTRICGTPGFMAPEQISGQPVDARSDIYALGAILYQCLCGEPPFIEDDLNALLMKHVAGTPPALRALDLEIPVDVELDALVLAMLAKEPRDRPQSVIAIRETLDRIELRMNGAEVPRLLFPDKTSRARLDTEDVDTSPSAVGLEEAAGEPMTPADPKTAPAIDSTAQTDPGFESAKTAKLPKGGLVGEPDADADNTEVPTLRHPLPPPADPTLPATRAADVRWLHLVAIAGAIFAALLSAAAAVISLYLR